MTASSTATTALCSALLLLSTVSAENIVFPTTAHSRDNPSCYGSRLHKISMVQTMYVQYSEFVTSIPIPSMESVSTCFWMNVEEGGRAATPLNYGLDEATNTDNLTIQYRPSEGVWSMNLNGVRVYSARAIMLTPQTWNHFCHSWDGRTGEWSVWQNGQLLQAGVNEYSIGTIIPGSGVMVTGQHQNTLSNMGMDAGEGIRGSITLLHVSSKGLGNQGDFATHRLVRYLANDCTATDRGDVVGWLRTPRRGYGGVLVEVAFEKCRQF